MQQDQALANLEVELFQVTRRGGRGVRIQTETRRLKHRINTLRNHPSYLLALREMRAIALLLPEISQDYDPLKHAISPLFGTAAQQLPVRSFKLDYTNLQSLDSQGGCTLSAVAPTTL